MIARVVVDVPAGGADRLFDYKIPPHLEEMVETGMRVVVPFGVRKLQGFVVSISETTEIEQVKEISEVLDVLPVLTRELLELGNWLSLQILCFKITVFQAMLPSALKAKYRKIVAITSEQALQELPPQLRVYFHHHEKALWDELISNDITIARKIKKLVLAGLLEIVYEVNDKKTKKVVRTVETICYEQMQMCGRELAPHAKKQQQLLKYLLAHPGRFLVSELIEQANTTTATVKSFVEKGILIERKVEVTRDPYAGRQFNRTLPLPLTTNQQQVITPIYKSIKEGFQETFLIHGVTGSGKTEVYLQAIAKAIEKGKEAIVLVPEISLTPQMVQRFKERFGSLVAVLHSQLSVGEKYDEWRKIHHGTVKVVVGARSAIFAPFQNIGIIIIDEEHEATYKQEENPRYHARDVAIKRATYHQCPLLLGSATPSLESYARAQKGVYQLLQMSERVNERPLPAVEIVDMREELRSGNRSMFSAELHEKLLLRLERNEQTVLFLNRRGYSTFVMCRDCGYVAQCPHCDISLTYHQTSRSLKCHYCGYQQGMQKKCASCESEQIRFFGSGTQKVEEEIARIYPGARVIRMDVDTTRQKGAHEKLLKQFAEGRADILLGTQMIAKGLDFPNVTLVGVLAADSMLHLPDFRASERTFQLLTQVSGRAGRHQLPGEVVIQAYSPEHYSIMLVRNHDFKSFFSEEMTNRRKQGYPPYYFLAVVQVSHEEITRVIEISEKITVFLRRHVSKKTIVLGPVACSIPRIKDRYRYQCMIKYKNEPNLTALLQEVLNQYNRELTQGDLQIFIDMNPFTLN